MNVVTNTNLVISAIFWPGESRQCLELWAKRRFHLAISVTLFEEYDAIARRVARRIPEVNPEPWLNKVGVLSQWERLLPACSFHREHYGWAMSTKATLVDELV